MQHNVERVLLIAEAHIAGIWHIRYGCLHYLTDDQMRAAIAEGRTDKPTLEELIVERGVMAAKMMRKSGKAEPKRKKVVEEVESGPQRMVLWVVNHNQKADDPPIEQYVTTAAWVPIGEKPEGKEYREFQSLATYADIESAERAVELWHAIFEKLVKEGKITGSCVTSCDVGDEARTLAMDDEALEARDRASREADNAIERVLAGEEEPDEEEDDEEDEEPEEDDEENE